MPRDLRKLRDLKMDFHSDWPKDLKTGSPKGMLTVMHLAIMTAKLTHSATMMDFPTVRPMAKPKDLNWGWQRVIGKVKPMEKLKLKEKGSVTLRGLPKG